MRFLQVLLLSFVLLYPGAALAETSIAVVDVQALLTKSDAAKSVAKQANDYKTKFMADLSKQEQSLRESEKKLTEQRSSLSKEEFAKKAKEFEAKLVETRRQAEKKKKAFDQASGKALGTLRDKLYEVVQGIAKERGYNLVISKQNVIVGEESMDITEEAMKRLNKSISSLTLDISKE